MPNPPAQPNSAVVTQIGWTAGSGPALMPAITQAQTLPGAIPQPTATSVPNLVGYDAIPFTLTLAAGAASATFTFPALPNRNNTQNPLAPNTVSQPPYVVAAQDHLIFTVSQQNVVAPAGTVLTLEPFALDQNEVSCPGPFLGSNVFKTFSVTVSATNSSPIGTVRGIVVGQLVLSSG